MRTNNCKNNQLPDQVVAVVNSTDDVFVKMETSQHVNLKLRYLNAEQVRRLIKMFDSAEAYAENFSALKAITRGLYKLIEDSPDDQSRIARMFRTVNNMQGALLLDNADEVERIVSRSGLMPDPWGGFSGRNSKGDTLYPGS
ncbi:hypothetical protein [Pedobacter faecalis]|uniref:hypothetical protein n=1 Tax=Pedobacter faecalis TaxID=3041495 RepID=UPI00254BF151|nr:hypothetical protein [Pedobacter sp. ELA7]